MATQRQLRIDDEVLGVLDSLTVSLDGTSVKIEQKLDRKLYEKVNEVLNLIGGAWNRKAKAHLFSEDFRARLEEVMLTRNIERPKSFGYFPTPMPVIAKLISLALDPHVKDKKATFRVLEPSAGQGAIAKEILLWADPENLVCVELLEKNMHPLMANLLPGCKVFCGDFLTLDPVTFGGKGSFDRVIMNPPFERQQDLDHVRHAYGFLKPGGRLVAVMASGVTFRTNKKTTDFFDFFGGTDRVRITELPPNSFKESGTGVNTVIAVIDKPVDE